MKPLHLKRKNSLQKDFKSNTISVNFPDEGETITKDGQDSAKSVRFKKKRQN